MFFLQRYNPAVLAWEYTYVRDEPTSYSFFSEPQPGTLWIMGHGSYYDRTYLLNQPEGMSPGPDLPFGMDRACAVAINDTHTLMAGGHFRLFSFVIANYLSNTVAIFSSTGGSTGIVHSWTFIYDWTQGEWSMMAEMNEGRYYHTCGLVTNPATGEREVVALPGVYNERTTEIYNIDSNAWRYGSDYPEDTDYVRVAQDKDTFYAFGGWPASRDSYSDTIYRFDEASYEFVLLDQRLPYQAHEALGLIVSMNNVVATK